MAEEPKVNGLAEALEPKEKGVGAAAEVVVVVVAGWPKLKPETGLLVSEDVLTLEEAEFPKSEAPGVTEVAGLPKLKPVAGLLVSAGVELEAGVADGAEFPKSEVPGVTELPNNGLPVAAVLALLLLDAVFPNKDVDEEVPDELPNKLGVEEGVAADDVVAGLNRSVAGLESELVVVVVVAGVVEAGLELNWNKLGAGLASELGLEPKLKILAAGLLSEATVGVVAPTAGNVEGELNLKPVVVGLFSEIAGEEPNWKGVTAGFALGACSVLAGGVGNEEVLLNKVLVWAELLESEPNNGLLELGLEVAVDSLLVENLGAEF